MKEADATKRARSILEKWTDSPTEDDLPEERKKDFQALLVFGLQAVFKDKTTKVLQAAFCVVYQMGREDGQNG